MAFAWQMIEQICDQKKSPDHYVSGDFNVQTPLYRVVSDQIKLRGSDFFQIGHASFAV